jgi:hypothetical protein
MHDAVGERENEVVVGAMEEVVSARGRMFADVHAAAKRARMMLVVFMVMNIDAEFRVRFELIKRWGEEGEVLERM